MLVMDTRVMKKDKKLIVSLLLTRSFSFFVIYKCIKINLIMKVQKFSGYRKYKSRN